jgi:hypothetical protein
MKKIFTLLFSCFSVLSFAQINVGNNQTICLGDTAQVIATTSVQASTDSYQVTSITFAPEATTGTAIPLSDDDVQGPFPIGFTFQFYGNNYTDFYVGSNGWIGFSSGQPTSYFASPIPDSISTTIPRNCIMLSWEDLNPSTGGQVLYQTMGTAPNRKLVFTFDNVTYFASTLTMTSQVVLYEGSNVIDNHITDKALHNNPSIQGIHNLLGTAATVVPGRNATVWSASNESVRYFPSGVSWFDVNSGQMVGVGDTLNYSPTQTTFVAGQIIDSTGQVHSDTMRINVLNTQITSSGLSLCNGPITLTAASGFALYVWNNNAASPQMLVTSAGTYYVNCTNSNGSVCQSPPITIYANTMPITLGTADSIEICQGDTVNINGPTGYSSYSWSTGETTVAISTTSVGDYYLTTLDANGCIGISDTTNVSVRILEPNLTTDYMTVCYGYGTSIYTDPIYQTYLWSNNNTFSSIFTTVPGNYWVTVADAAGCSGTSDTLTIVNGNFTFDLLPSDSLFLCTPSSSVVIDATNAGLFGNFQWSTGATTPTITTSSIGNYYCIFEILGFNGTCYGSSDTVEVSGINPQLTYSGLSLCAGPVSLNTSNYDIYQWSNNASTQAINVNTAGDYYVFVTDSNGCTAYSDTVSIYTNAFQYSIVPSGSTTICSGYTVDLDAGNQFTGHLWNTGASTSTITASTIGQYYASMTDVNGCSGYTDTVDVTNISVNLTTTGYSLCNPQSYPILNAGTGYYIYNWSTGDTISSITANFPGNYYLSVIDQNGCTADSDTISIYLNQFTFNVNAVGSNFLCQPSGQVTLDAGSGYFQYLWSTGANSQQTTVNATGNYTVTVSDMNGCPGVSNPFTVHNVVLTSTITGLSNVMQNNVETYSVIQNLTSTYNWGVTGGILQSGLGTNSVDVLWNTPGQGSIYVIETDANGCIGDTISLAVTIFQSTDIIENPSQQISIYPNPFTKSTIISITNIKSNYNLTLYDVTGQKVWKEEDLNQRTYELERGTLSKGIYFLEIKTEESKSIKRVVVN